MFLSKDCIIGKCIFYHKKKELENFVFLFPSQDLCKIWRNNHMSEKSRNTNKRENINENKKEELYKLYKDKTIKKNLEGHSNIRKRK